MVQQPPDPRADRRPTSGQGRSAVLSPNRAHGAGRVTHTKQSPEFPARFNGVLAVALRRNRRNEFMLLTIRQDGSRVISLVRQQGLGIHPCNLLPSPRSPTPAPASHARPQPSAASCSAPFCATHRLIAADRTARMGMDLEMTGVNHQPLIVRLIHQMLQQRPQSPLSRQRQNRRWVFFQSP